jgi:PAS domain S-box-containing protein
MSEKPTFEELERRIQDLEQAEFERKRAEQALRESEERFRQVYKHMAVGVSRVSLEFRFEGANEAYCSMLGYREEELIGKHLRDITHPESVEENLRKQSQLAAGEIDHYRMEKRFAHKSGRVIHGILDANLVRDTEGKPLYFLGSVLDITERKQAEEEKLALERKVQQAQKLESLGVLAGGIAHDFNNILMTILGNADLALVGLSPMSPVRGNLQEIEKAVKRAAELVEQMLAYSGKGRFVVEPIDAGELIEEIAHLLEVSISKKAVLKYNLAENLPAFDGDVSQIRQVIMNLITNALEAIRDKSGVITLSTGAVDCDRAYLNDVQRSSLDEPLPEGVYTYLEVADTGCGMDAETIKKIFDPFFTTKFTGRGLGMSAVLGIVRGHKGALKIDSEVGKGTMFKVLFPANELPDNGFAVRRKDETEGKDLRGSGTVLIADDEETVCAVGKQMLEHMGFSVLAAPDGREALKVFREHADEIVCVLLDLTMPHMDGEEAFREMRRLQPGVTVILCSGYNEQDATQRFAGKGLSGFIQKPYNMAALREKLVDVLAAGEGEQ